MNIKLKALRPLSGDDYGRVLEGQEFFASDRTALLLEARGLACRVYEAKAMAAPPENKMLLPPANKSAVTIKSRQK